MLQAQLDGHEQELNSKRVQLKAAKSAADRSLAQEQKLRESNPYVTAASLLNDLEVRACLDTYGHLSQAST